jgi:hypothetical protein
MQPRRLLSPLHSGDRAFLYMDQAGPTVGHWLHQSVEQIDGIFGEGYAKKNPALVAAFIQAAAADQLTSHLSNTVAERFGDISLALSTVASRFADQDY